MSDEIVTGNSGEGQALEAQSGPGAEARVEGGGPVVEGLGEAVAEGAGQHSEGVGTEGAMQAATPQVSDVLELSGAGMDEFVGQLTAKQQVVLRALLETPNVSEVSRRTGVGRTRIYQWMNYDEQFEAALNAWKREALRVSLAKAVGLVQPCVEAVRAAVEKGNANLAFKVGKSMGVFAPPRVGSDDAGEVRMRRARKAKAKKVRIAKKDKELAAESGEKLKAAQTIYEIDELIEQLMLERMKALRAEDAQEKVAREKNQRVLRKGDERLEGIARAIRDGSEGRGEGEARRHEGT